MAKGKLKRILVLVMACVLTLSLTTFSSCGDGIERRFIRKGDQVLPSFPRRSYNSFIESKLHEYEAAHPDIKFEITSAQNQGL